MFEHLKNLLFPPKVEEKPTLKTSTAVMSDFFFGDYSEEEVVDTNLLKEGGENAPVIPSTSGAAWASHIPDPVKASTEVVGSSSSQPESSVTMVEIPEEPQHSKATSPVEEPKSSWDLLDIGESPQ